MNLLKTCVYMSEIAYHNFSLQCYLTIKLIKSLTLFFLTKTRLKPALPTFPSFKFSGGNMLPTAIEHAHLKSVIPTLFSLFISTKSLTTSTTNRSASTHSDNASVIFNRNVDASLLFTSKNFTNKHGSILPQTHLNFSESGADSSGIALKASIKATFFQDSMAEERESSTLGIESSQR
ncbi:hypothetical protein RND81_09G113000 [Saponaria officinalis]|uniref:Uncharacterized protein n=1 Tax=Saponaria officinalis TaxID=3572 RepID=A0AAW1IJC8_SAPOF